MCLDAEKCWFRLDNMDAEITKHCNIFESSAVFLSVLQTLWLADWYEILPDTFYEDTLCVFWCMGQMKQYYPGFYWIWGGEKKGTLSTIFFCEGHFDMHYNSTVHCDSHCQSVWSQIARFMGPTWGPSGSCRPKLGPILAPWTLLSGVWYGDITHCGLVTPYIWCHRSGSTLVQVMAYCLTAPSHYLNECWLINHLYGPVTFIWEWFHKEYHSHQSLN